ncbi:MAG: hypothetical protein Q9190_008086 [Brigantiaea leucoxantha]
MVPLIVLAPIIVLVVTWIIQLLAFSHSQLLNESLYNPRSFLAKPRYKTVSRQECEFLKASSIWVKLHCDKGDILGDVVAPLAGIEISPDDKGTEIVQAALEKLWPLDTQREYPRKTPPAEQVKTSKAHSIKQRTAHSGMEADNHLTKCKLAIVEEAIQRKDNRARLLFASCTFADLPLAHLLSSAGASVAPSGSASFAALENFEQDNLRARPEEAYAEAPISVQDAQAKALTIQTWVATLLGFMGAAFSLIDANRSRKEQRERLGRKTTMLWNIFRLSIPNLELALREPETERASKAKKRTLRALIDVEKNITMQSKDRNSEWTLTAIPLIQRTARRIDNGDQPDDTDMSELSKLIEDQP